MTEFRVTPRQDLLLHGIAAGRAAEVEQRLRDHGVAAGRRRDARCAGWRSPARRCRRAARRSARPSGCCRRSSTELEKALADGGVGDAPIRLNMTGCPNGCARPYNAEIGIVGRTKTSYDVYVGGSAVGDRLGRAHPQPTCRSTSSPRPLAPVFAHYAGHSAGEWSATAFGAWAERASARRRS